MLWIQSVMMLWRTGIGLWSLLHIHGCMAMNTYTVSSTEGPETVGGVYMGCFAKNSQELPFFWWPYNNKNSTLGRCYSSCQNAFFSYAAISGKSMRCYCGNSGYDMYGSATSCFDCTMESQKFMCAPDDAMGVYQTEWKLADSRYMGCWYGNPSVIGADVEKALIGQDPELTVDSCIKVCRKKFLEETDFSSNTTYVAIRGGKQCFCGKDLKSEDAKLEDVTPALSGCDLPCAGNSSQLCGGEMLSSFFSIYRAVCSDGHYGLDCKPCECPAGYTCDKISGECHFKCDDCDSGCKDGFFGESCVPCNCPDDFPCNKVTGVCPSQRCGRGWRRSADGICSLSCPANQFGEDCSRDCHCLNSYPCQSSTGTCPFKACAAGYHGPTCSEPCQPDRYGEDCRRKCPCEFCDNISGLCVENCIEGAPCRLRGDPGPETDTRGTGVCLDQTSCIIIVQLLLVFASVVIMA